MGRKIITDLYRIYRRVIDGIQRALDFTRHREQRQVFIQAAQSVTPPPSVNLDLLPGATVLVVSAHADDETLGCLGLLQAHLALGCAIEWLVLTDGRNATGGHRSAEKTATLRHNEAKVIQTALGWQVCHWWGIPCPAVYSEYLRASLIDLITDIKPALIYAPFAYNHHPEHRLAAMLVAEATPESIPIRWYAIQTPLTPVFTTAVYANAEQKRQTEDTLQLYQSQHYMRRSFRAVILLQQLEGLLYSQLAPVTAICELPTDRRLALIRALAAAAEAESPCKPNQPAYLWRDYLHLWSQATHVAETIGLKTFHRSALP
jgi:LmbE family N-acetylglucosaminyl deacetylase